MTQPLTAHRLETLASRGPSRQGCSLKPRPFSMDNSVCVCVCVFVVSVTLWKTIACINVYGYLGLGADGSPHNSFIQSGYSHLSPHCYYVLYYSLQKHVPRLVVTTWAFEYQHAGLVAAWGAAAIKHLPCTSRGYNLVVLAIEYTCTASNSSTIYQSKNALLQSIEESGAELPPCNSSDVATFHRLFVATQQCTRREAVQHGLRRVPRLHVRDTVSGRGDALLRRRNLLQPRTPLLHSDLPAGMCQRRHVHRFVQLLRVSRGLWRNLLRKR